MINLIVLIFMSIGIGFLVYKAFSIGNVSENYEWMRYDPLKLDYETWEPIR